MLTIELFGYIATVLMAVSLIPQVVKSWRTKSTKDISIGWNSLYITALVFWIIYGVGIHGTPLVVSATIEIILALFLLTLKLKYG